MFDWFQKIFSLIRLDKEYTSKELGKAGEDEAVRLLRNKGLKIIGRNVRIGKYEIDLIAQDGKEIVFVEVKTYKDNKWGYPEDKVDYKKRKNLKRAGNQYILRYSPKTKSYRFDIVAITWEPTVSVYWIKDAF